MISPFIKSCHALTKTKRYDSSKTESFKDVEWPSSETSSKVS